LVAGVYGDGGYDRGAVGVKASIQDKYITQPISQIRKKVN
jgi:N-acetylmuramoyl-L-alanine amidase